MNSAYTNVTSVFTHTYTNKLTFNWRSSLCSLSNYFQKPEQRSRYSNSLRAGRSENRNPVGERFSAPVQTGSESHPASSTMGTGSFLGVKRPRRGVDHSPPYNFFSFLRRYNFGEVLAFSTSFFHLVRFLMQSFEFVIFILVISLFTSSSHLFLGLPSDLVSAGDHSYFFLPCCYLAYDVRVRTKLIFVL